MTTRPKRRRRLAIRVDTREQNALELPTDYCTTARGRIPFGDYALEAEVVAWEEGGKGYPLPFAVERKSLDDFVASVIGQGEHRKLMRALEHGTKPVIYVVEARESDLRPRRECPCLHMRPSMRCKQCGGKDLSCACVMERCDLHCEFCGGVGWVGYDYSKFRNKGAAMEKVVMSKLCDWRYGLGVQVVFAGDRELAAAWVVKFLQRRDDELRIAGVLDVIKDKEGVE